MEGTKTFFVIRYEDILKNQRKQVTYTKVVCEVRPQKEDPNCTRITIGGNQICYRAMLVHQQDRSNSLSCY